MAIKSYADKTAYENAQLSTTESQVSLIETSREVMVDGVNVITTEPKAGDVLFLDENNKKVFLKGGDWLKKAIIPSAWTLVGYVFWRGGNEVKILDKDSVTLRYAPYAEYSITAISSTSITLNMRLSNNYNTNTAITVTLEDTSLNAANALAIKTAIEAKCTEVSATNVPWAYYDETNNKIIIVVAWKNYQQYNISGSGCTVALTIWDDMPANSSNGFRANGMMGQVHSINIARSVIYYGTNGSTPTAAVALNADAEPVNKTSFESSEYCAALRAAYGTYEAYIEAEYKLMYPQKLGVFGLPDAKTLTKKYGNRTVVLADGTAAYAFPALHHALTVGYNCEGMEEGDWQMSGAEDGAVYMADNTLALVAASQSIMGTTVLSNSAHRWFAQRYSPYSAWIFYGNDGNLNGGLGVFSRIQVQAVLNLSL